jgi:sugar-specific transcriptional regulator TrmB
MSTHYEGREVIVNADVVSRLIELGFSQYEAQAYLGLLGQEPMTGYALSNATGIPQPKVYETLRRLVRKGVAVPVPGDPARFVALPPAQLLSQLDNDFRRRLSDAEVGLARAAGADGEAELTVLRVVRAWSSIEDGAVDLLEQARRHVYISVNLDEPGRVIEAIERLDSRGVPSEILHFGDAPLTVSHGRLLRHQTTDGIVYRHHQARHLAIVADGSKVLWSLAADGTDWESVSADDALLAAAVKGYIRHDIYVQQIAQDFGDVLSERYGPGLEQLVVPRERQARDTAPKRSRRRQTA